MPAFATHIRTVQAICLFWLLATGGSLVAQQDQFNWQRSAYAPARPPEFPRRPHVEEIVRPPGEPETEESARRPRVEQLLGSLAEARGELKRELENQATAKTPIGRQTSLSRSPAREIESLLRTSETQRREQTEKINRMIGRLEAQLIAEAAARKRNAQTTPAKVQPPNRADEGPRFHEPDQSPNGRNVPHDGANVPTPADRKAAPLDVTGAAVDRLRLADALFGQQKFELARDIYLQLQDSPAHATERVWIEFQIASCYRNLDDIPNAEKYYRLVVGSKQETPLADYARWWLGAIQKQQGARRLLDLVTQSITEQGQQTDGNESVH